MDIKHGDETPWECVSGHRGGGIDFRHLLIGREGAKDNHHLSMWRENGGFFSPRHRHNFDQIRSASRARSRHARPDDPAGRHRCFPRALSTGLRGRERRRDVQFGSASGGGFVSFARWPGRSARSRSGARSGTGDRAARGRRPRHEAQPGQLGAIWEHVTGKRLACPAPRYSAPFVMYPELRVGSRRGAARRGATPSWHVHRAPVDSTPARLAASTASCRRARAHGLFRWRCCAPATSPIARSPPGRRRRGDAHLRAEALSEIRRRTADLRLRGPPSPSVGPALCAAVLAVARGASPAPSTTSAATP
jgi:hypothetical protein